MDKIDTLFTQPLVAKKSSEEAVDFNKWLIYDEEKIYCGNTNFTYEDLFEVFYADSLLSTSEARRQLCTLNEFTPLPLLHKVLLHRY